MPLHYFFRILPILLFRDGCGSTRIERQIPVGVFLFFLLTSQQIHVGTEGVLRHDDFTSNLLLQDRAFDTFVCKEAIIEDYAKPKPEK